MFHFFLKLIYLDILFQMTFYYENNEVVEYKIKIILNKKFE